MVYSENIAARVRSSLGDSAKVEEKKMMGGLTFMVNDKMCVGVLGDELMVRLDPAVYETALAKKGCREMDFTGRPMKGFVFVSPEGMATEQDLDFWLTLALAYNKKVKVTAKKKKRQRE